MNDPLAEIPVSVMLMEVILNAWQDAECQLIVQTSADFNRDIAFIHAKITHIANTLGIEPPALHDAYADLLKGENDEE